MLHTPLKPLTLQCLPCFPTPNPAPFPFHALPCPQPIPATTSCFYVCLLSLSSNHSTPSECLLFLSFHTNLMIA